MRLIAALASLTLAMGMAACGPDDPPPPPEPTEEQGPTLLEQKRAQHDALANQLKDAYIRHHGLTDQTEKDDLEAQIKVWEGQKAELKKEINELAAAEKAAE